MQIIINSIKGMLNVLIEKDITNVVILLLLSVTSHVIFQTNPKEQSNYLLKTNYL